MKTQLIQAMGSFVLGGSVALVGLLSWTGTTDLQAIRTSVQNHMTDTEQQVSLFMQEDYKVQVDNANTEIGAYKDALAQANSNIDKLITAYNNAETEHQTEVSNLQKELGNANTKYEQDLAELQTKLSEMETRLDSQYETDMNKVIEQANAQIKQANEEVAQAKENVLKDLQTSQIDEYIKQAKEYDKVNTGNDKSVHDISSIVPTEQQGE